MQITKSDKKHDKQKAYGAVVAGFPPRGRLNKRKGYNAAPQFAAPQLPAQDICSRKAAAEAIGASAIDAREIASRISREAP